MTTATAVKNFRVTYLCPMTGQLFANVFDTYEQAHAFWESAVEEGRIDPMLYSRRKDGVSWSLRAYVAETDTYTGTVFGS
jgi:hypothetical protein